MASQRPETLTLIAGANLSAAQFLAVKLTTTGTVVLAGAGEDAIGILQNNPLDGQPATVAHAGISKFVAGGNITAGDRVAADAAGKAKTAVGGRTNTSDAGAAADPLLGSFVLGQALEGGVNNQIITVLLGRAGAIPTTAA